MVYKFFDKKTESGLSGNEEIAQELNKPVIKTFKKGKSMQSLKIVFGQQIPLKFNYYLLNFQVLNIYYVWKILSPNILWLSLSEIKFFMVLLNSKRI